MSETSSMTTHQIERCFICGHKRIDSNHHTLANALFNSVHVYRLTSISTDDVIHIGIPKEIRIVLKCRKER